MILLKDLDLDLEYLFFELPLGYPLPQGYPLTPGVPPYPRGSPNGESFIYYKIMLKFAPKVYFEILLQNFGQDLEYLNFGLPPGIPSTLEGTPKGVSRGKSFVYLWIQLKFKS